MAISFSVREGFANFRRAKFAVLASTSAMAVALVLIGLFVLLSFKAQQVSEWLRQRVGEVEIFLDDQIEDPVAQALNERAAAMPGVAETEFVTRQQAQEIFLREFGEGGEIFFDEPFLPASIKVRVESDYANPDSLARLVHEFGTWNRVDEVVFNQPLLVKVQRNLRILTTYGLSLGVLVMLASIFLVANTIRLAIYARRLLIRTMKLVGATDAFVRRPFVVEGILQGVLAGMVAGAVLWGLYDVMARYLSEIMVADALVGGLLLAGVIAMGIGLGWVGSAVAVRRFIKHVALH